MRTPAADSAGLLRIARFIFRSYAPSLHHAIPLSGYRFATTAAFFQVLDRSLAASLNLLKPLRRFIKLVFIQPPCTHPIHTARRQANHYLISSGTLYR